MIFVFVRETNTLVCIENKWGTKSDYAVRLFSIDKIPTNKFDAMILVQKMMFNIYSLQFMLPHMYNT